jgi:hypothetical protein
VCDRAALSTSTRRFLIDLSNSHELPETMCSRSRGACASEV